MKNNRQLNIPFIQQVIENKQITRQQLSENIGVSVSGISDWTTGKQNPSWQNIIKLAKALDVSVENILLYSPSQTADMRSTIFSTVMGWTEQIAASGEVDDIEKASKILARHFEVFVLGDAQPAKKSNTEEHEELEVPDIPQEEAIASLLGGNK